jgi:hypothetical protein
VVPVLFGDGVRLFDDHVAAAPADLALTRVVASPASPICATSSRAERARRPGISAAAAVATTSAVAPIANAA